MLVEQGKQAVTALKSPTQRDFWRQGFARPHWRVPETSDVPSEAVIERSAVRMAELGRIRSLIEIRLSLIERAR
jgi:hypothetical protein